MNKKGNKKEEPNRNQYNMWTCPAEQRVQVFADVDLTPELISELDDVPLPDKKEIEEQTSSFDVPVTEKTLSVMVR